MEADHPAERSNVSAPRGRRLNAALNEGRPPRQRTTGSASDTHQHDRLRGAVPRSPLVVRPRAPRALILSSDTPRPPLALAVGLLDL
eukprot:202088-Prymnesium_polylepis.1